MEKRSDQGNGSCLGIAINGRQRPTLIQATRAATAFTTGLALPGGYTYVVS